MKGIVCFGYVATASTWKELYEYALCIKCVLLLEQLK